MALLHFFNNYGFDSPDDELYFLDGLVVLGVFVVLYVTYQLIDEGYGYWEESSGKIEGELYTPETNSTGIGTGVGANGQLVTMATSSHSPEAWYVVVREDNTNVVIKIGCSMQYVYDVKPGDRVKFRRKYGKYSKKYFKTEII